MMKSDNFYGIIAYSGYRSGLLKFLGKEGAQTLTQIKDEFDVKSPEILPRLKELKQYALVEQNERTKIWSISPLGKAALHYLSSLIDLTESLDANKDFWTSHDLSMIPENLLYRLGDLKECNLISADSASMLDSHPEFSNNVSKACSVIGGACIFHESWIQLFLKLVEYGVSIELILTPEVYRKLQRDYPRELKKLLSGNSIIRISQKLNISFVVTDDWFSLSLNTKQGWHDTMNDLQSIDQRSLKWGKDLFTHFRDLSEEVIPEFSFTEKEVSKLLRT